MRALGVGVMVLVFASVALLAVPAVGALGAAGAAAPSFLAASSASDGNHGFDHPGNLLITDQFNNRVIEVNPLTKQIVWSFGSGNSKLCNPGPHAVIGPNDAERLSGGLTAIVGTGIPSGVPGTTACVDNRMIVVDPAGAIVWQYGVAGKTGSGFDRLNVPVFVIQLPNHHFLITDQGNNRIIEVNLAKKVVWSYGPTSGPGALNSPNSAELLPNGHILIADELNNRAIEITGAGKIVDSWSHGLNTVAFASRLPNGDTLITDSGHNRVVEFNAQHQVVFQYRTNTSAHSNAAPLPTNAVRIHGGDTIIADQFNDRVIVITPQHRIAFQYGHIDQPGHGFNALFGPYTAYEIGDYTGQTAPPAQFL